MNPRRDGRFRHAHKICECGKNEAQPQMHLKGGTMLENHLRELVRTTIIFSPGAWTGPVLTIFPRMRWMRWMTGMPQVNSERLHFDGRPKDSAAFTRIVVSKNKRGHLLGNKNTPARQCYTPVPPAWKKVVFCENKCGNSLDRTSVYEILR